MAVCFVILQALHHSYISLLAEQCSGRTSGTCAVIHVMSHFALPQLHSMTMKVYCVGLWVQVQSTIVMCSSGQTSEYTINIWAVGGVWRASQSQIHYR